MFFADMVFQKFFVSFSPVVKSAVYKSTFEPVITFTCKYLTCKTVHRIICTVIMYPPEFFVQCSRKTVGKVFTRICFSQKINIHELMWATGNAQNIFLKIVTVHQYQQLHLSQILTVLQLPQKDWQTLSPVILYPIFLPAAIRSE